tara:strand:- start:1491 stop:2534 length:1044 start_codon:yes stop_codon:yes gene_type:complete
MFAITKKESAKGVWASDIKSPSKPGNNDVQVRVTHAGICGTDLHIYKWDEWARNRIKPPLVIGHEFVGVIVAVGKNVTKYKVGQRVSAECHVVCGVCRYCRTGRGHLCAETSIIGVDRDGIFTGLVNLPASNIWGVDEGIPNHHAAIFDPIGNAMHAVSKGEVAGHSVVITGAGAIGLIAIAIARSLGARHISVIEPQEYKRKLALELGADIAMAPGIEANNTIMSATNNVGPHVLLEMSGNAAAIDNALGLLQPGGTAVMLGIPSEPIQFDLAEKFVFKGLTMKGIIGREMFNTWFQVESFMLNNPEAVEKIITHILPAKDFQKGFDMMEEGTCGKIVLEFEGAEA